MTLANGNPDTEIFHIGRGYIDPVFGLILANYRATVNDGWIAEYHSPVHFEDRQRFRRYCREVLQLLHERYGVDLLILPKLHDDWFIDFILAAQELKLPILSNERETVVTPQRLETSPPLFKKYVGILVDRLCIANQGHEQYWIRADFPRERMAMIGDIKSDFWWHPELWKTRSQIHPALRDERVVLLFFAFGKNTYRHKGGETRNWLELTTGFHQVLLNLLRKYKGRLQVVYKTGSKTDRDRFDGLDDFLRDVRSFCDSSDFLNLDNEYCAQNLIVNSDVVLGFQTTGLIEAMFTDKPIVTGGWGGFYEDSCDSLLPLHKTGAVSLVRSQDELERTLSGFIESPRTVIAQDVLEERKSFRERYYFQPDGGAAKRLLAEAHAVLDGPRGLERADSEKSYGG